MSHEEVVAMVTEMGLPNAYDHFAEGESPDPPFLIFLPPLYISYEICNITATNSVHIIQYINVSNNKI